ncbi:phage antirepressor KilAC domain-containing protein, partial [Escherichia coli]|uniref:phage antirepressor KilAC domain-containing protein n=1 Tax=Escherichia coli TaxID=562 RepID=UPI003CFA0827
KRVFLVILFTSFSGSLVSRIPGAVQEYMDRGYFTVKETAVNTNHGIQISFTTKITGRGQQWLTRKLLDNGVLKVTGEAA